MVNTYWLRTLGAKYGSRMFLCGLVLADARKGKKKVDPWWDVVYRADMDWTKIAGSDYWSVEEWTEFWRGCIFINCRWI